MDDNEECLHQAVRFDVAAEIKDKDVEVQQKVSATIIKLTEELGPDAYKNVAAANMLIICGIRTLLDCGVCPGALVEFLGDTIKDSLDGKNALRLMIPEFIVEQIAKKNTSQLS